MANIASGSSLLWLFLACWPGGIGPLDHVRGEEPQGRLVHSGYGSDRGL